MKQRYLVLTLFVMAIMIITPFSKANAISDYDFYATDVSVDKAGEVLNTGDSVTITCKLNTTYQLNRVSVWLAGSSHSETIRMDYDETTDLYKATLTLTNAVYEGEYHVYQFQAYADIDGKSTYVTSRQNGTPGFGYYRFYYSPRCITNGHDYDGTIVYKKAPTCTAAGYNVQLCQVCNYQYYTSVPAKGHSWYDAVVTREPTCACEGEKKVRCINCNEIKLESIPKTDNHIWDGGIVIKEATSKESGIKEYSCTICGVKKNIDIPYIAKVKIGTLSPKVKGFKVSYKAVKNASYYQIKYSIKPSMALSKTIKTTSLYKTVKSLKAKKKYYIKVRAIGRTSEGELVYGDWSTRRYITTK